MDMMLFARVLFPAHTLKKVHSKLEDSQKEAVTY
jgi:hypothetical protein